jgi:hypothetical protein
VVDFRGKFVSAVACAINRDLRRGPDHGPILKAESVAVTLAIEHDAECVLDIIEDVNLGSVSVALDSSALSMFTRALRAHPSRTAKWMLGRFSALLDKHDDEASSDEVFS